jgi:hypothetical protein
LPGDDGGVTVPPGDGSAPLPEASGPQPGSLTGRVLVFEDENFTSAADFVGIGEVGGEGANGRVTATFSGASYRLDAVTLGQAAFFDLTATETQEDLLFAVELVDASDGSADLHFVRRTVMDFIGQSLSAAEPLQDGRGHAILFFRDANGNGSADIQVDGAGAIVAYDTGSGIFRDDFGATSERGTVAILNAEAIAFPGSVVSISYSGASSGTVDVKLAGNAVTLVTVVP